MSTPATRTTIGLATTWFAALGGAHIAPVIDGHDARCELVDLGREHVLLGIGELTLWLTAWRVGFPDLAVSHLAVRRTDAALAAHVRLRGTHGGPFGGVPATGRRLDLALTDVMHVVRGPRVSRHFVHYDADELFGQLGVDRPPAYQLTSRRRVR